VRLPPCARPNGAACRPRRCCQATSNINIDHRGWLSKQFCYQDLGPVSKLQHRRVFQSSCATIKALWLTQCDQVIDPAWHRRPLLFRPPHSSLPSATFLQRRSSTCTNPANRKELGCSGCIRWRSVAQCSSLKFSCGLVPTRQVSRLLFPTFDTPSAVADAMRPSMSLLESTHHCRKTKNEAECMHSTRERQSSRSNSSSQHPERYDVPALAWERKDL
jgi:hypothetical protein